MAETIKVITSDDLEFQVPKDILFYSVTLKNMVDDMDGKNEDIPIPNLTGKTFENVLEYLYWHHAHPDALKPEDSKQCSLRTILTVKR